METGTVPQGIPILSVIASFFESSPLAKHYIDQSRRESITQMQSTHKFRMCTAIIRALGNSGEEVLAKLEQIRIVSAPRSGREPDVYNAFSVEFVDRVVSVARELIGGDKLLAYSVGTLKLPENASAFTEQLLIQPVGTCLVNWAQRYQECLFLHTYDLEAHLDSSHEGSLNDTFSYLLDVYSFLIIK